MKIAYNWAHNTFYSAQKLNTQTAYDIGGVDKVFEYTMSDIERLGPEFYTRNQHILSQKRGSGYWLFKMFFANYLLNSTEVPEDSWIIYADSGCYYVDSVDHIINVLERDGQSIFISRQNHLSYIWTKIDSFVYTDTNESKYTHSCMRAAGWQIFKKNDFSRKFYSEFLTYAQDYRVLTDAPNECGYPNYPGFRENRHDESLISLLAKKYELYPYRNPSQHGFCDDVDWTQNKYGEQGLKEMVERHGPISEWLNKYGLYFHGESLNQFPAFPNDIDDRSTYPQVFHLHRNSNITEVEPQHKR